jgi:FixJ family two-component response regulator/anti-sigma regulatory factor (Ser/Thr protein kinase)
MVIDDDQAVLHMVRDALVHHGMAVHPFSEGRLAMKLLEEPRGPQLDLVISDINMDGMDGFDVIHRVKSINPSLPVVLMTGQASLEYAIRAMRMGAANLFQKPLTLRELVNSVFHLVGLHRELRMAEAGLRGLVHETRRFCFRSNELDIPSTVMHLTDRLVPLGFASTTNVDVIAMAYHEALVNALEHGNLEMDSSLKSDLFSVKDSYSTLLQERRQDPEYATRPIEVFLEATPERYEVVITDGGKGFDARKVSRVSDETLARQCGRGLAMIHMVMDEVSHNEKGNQIRLVLKKKA